MSDIDVRPLVPFQGSRQIRRRFIVHSCRFDLEPKHVLRRRCAYDDDVATPQFGAPSGAVAADLSSGHDRPAHATSINHEQLITLVLNREVLTRNLQ
ncbi:MAG: hypothetical protein A3H29_04955 [Acidobacteria bacterium RIFCSPLOWO2_02_FULL_67_21]|nr:MAG: hypothetical protein A3H29_04955 [Acidobacteria bacterium RIFCSPLOWO2_02_FULL_67_21]